MKKIYTIYLVTSFLALGACKKDFLDTQMLTGKSASNYYSTPEHAYTALVGCYDGLQRCYIDWIVFPVISEILSDNCFGGGGIVDGRGNAVIDRFDRNQNPGDGNLFEGDWKYYYQAIYRCNMLIGKLNEVKWGSNASLRPIYESEARFIRAYCYFDLTRMFGKVPLMLDYLNATANLPRASVDDVYKQIAQDLIFAKQNGSSSKLSGRVNKYAADALLARVYLFYTGFYNKSDLVGMYKSSDALNGLDSVITSNKFRLVNKFYELWPAAYFYHQAVNNVKNYDRLTVNLEDSAETVFAIKYTYTGNPSDSKTSGLAGGDKNGAQFLTGYGMRETSSAKYGYGNGWGSAPINPALWKAYPDSDERKTSTIIAVKEEGIIFSSKTQREYTGYYIKKYTPTCDFAGKSIVEQLKGNSFQFSQMQDFIVIRYADVLLMAAELGSPSAVDYFNQVRARAGYKGTIPLTTEALRNERKLEFAGEAIRYWDLLRYDYTLDYAANALAINNFYVKSGLKQDSITIDASNFKAMKGLLQIPNNQIGLSGGVLDQNDGWK